MSNKLELQNNNIDLQGILTKVNTLPKKENIDEEVDTIENLTEQIKLALEGKAAGGSNVFAAIGVTYPEGSVCTCTNGTKTMEAGNTSGQWVFVIPETGTWTVEVGNKSQTVSITTEGQFEKVNLAELVLFDGEAIESFSVGNKATTAPTISNAISYSVNSSSASWSCGSVLTDNKIDLTEYKTLCVDVSIRTIHNTQYADGFILVDTDRNTQVYNYGNIPSGFISVGELLATGVNSLDISELSGSYYVGVGFAHNCTFEVTKIWLE